MSPEELAGLARTALGEDYRSCCLVGPEGSGKTTLLEDLVPLLQTPSVRIRSLNLQEETTRLEKKRALDSLEQLDQRDICLLDGGEVFSWMAWRRIRRMGRRRRFRLIATLHTSRGLPVLYRTKACWETTSQLVRSLAGPSLSPQLEPVARQAFTESSGNVREVFRACYLALMAHPDGR